MSEKTLNFLLVLILGSGGIGLIDSMRSRSRPDLIRIRTNDLWQQGEIIELLKEVIS